jgi:hypothetical protein
MRAQTAQIAPATALLKSECWRCRKTSAVVRSFFRSPTSRAARRPAESDSPKRPAARRSRRCLPVPDATLSTPYQTAAPSSRGQTRTDARISAECSNCEQTRARRLVFQDSWLLDTHHSLTLNLSCARRLKDSSLLTPTKLSTLRVFDSSNDIPAPFLVSTLVSLFLAYKSRRASCTHLNNRFCCLFGNICQFPQARSILEFGLF